MSRLTRAKASHALAVTLVWSLSACSEATPPPPTPGMTQAELMDPETCRGCHSSHYEEWSGSMHAYASLDPVFLAMNARGQRETGGELGDFCVQCHAPMALRLGLTSDGLNLHEVPAYAQGVTCYFCHSVESVEGTHNNPLKLADDMAMRGSYADPLPNSAHASLYSPHHDRNQRESAALCGSCHDIVTQQGVHLERTYTEWQNSLYGHPDKGGQQTCGSCHMAGRDDVAADVPGAPLRQVHHHGMPGVDIALTPFPQRDAQRSAVERALDMSVYAELCVASLEGETRITVNLENLSAGHGWPSGSAPDRRGWVEVIAFDPAGDVLYSSGAIADGQAVSEFEDADLWQLRDFTTKANGEPAHFFWEVAEYVSATLPAPTAVSLFDPDFTDIHRTRVYTYAGQAPARVEMRVKLRPIGLEILRDLVGSGDLDEEIVNAMPTFTLGITELSWLASDNVACVPAL